MARTVFRGGVVFDGTGADPSSVDVAVEDGRIVDVGHDLDGDDAVDGIKVDEDGNLYICGPSGIWVVAADGRHLGTLHLPEDPHNLAWGDVDGRSLYITALTSIYRLRLNVAGIRPA